jgi:hypothetical protein
MDYPMETRIIRLPTERATVTLAELPTTEAELVSGD